MRQVKYVKFAVVKFVIFCSLSGQSCIFTTEFSTVSFTSSGFGKRRNYS